MVQLKFLTGKQAGSVQVVRRFPCLVGRNPASDVRAEELGVWDQHFQIDLDASRGFVLKAQADALVCVNGQRIEEVFLKNGDLIEIGALKTQFWLNPTRQRSLTVREFLTWAALAILSVSQVGLVYWLSK